MTILVQEFRQNCNPELLKRFCIIGAITKSRNSNAITLKGKHGIVQSNWNKLCSQKSIPDIRSAIDKTSYFISMAKEIHGDTYSYERVHYINNRTKVKIICPTHGEFEQTPANHLMGKHCYQCARETIRQSQSKNAVGWTDSKWEQQGKVSNHFDGFKLYVLLCKDEREKFIKIGKTFNTVKRRHKEKHVLPYEWICVRREYRNAKQVCELERAIKKHFKNNKYVPEKNFGGCYECFSFDCLKQIHAFIDEH